MSALKKCDAQVIVMEPRLMPFKILGRKFKVMLRLIPLTLALGDFSA